MKKQKRNKWFKKVRASYLPISWQGRAIYLVYVTYVFIVPITWYVNGHDFWSLLTSVVPLLLAAGFFTQYIASKKA